MSRSVLFLFLICSTAAIDIRAEPTDALASQSMERRIRVGELQRRYRLHVPPKLPATEKRALVIVLHGGGGTAIGTERLTRFSELADRAGFIVAYPEGIGKSWNDGRDTTVSKAHRDRIDDVGFIAAIIDAIASDYPIDRKRIYATGISNGAIFSHYLAANLSSRIAAIAPVIGGLADPFHKNFKPEQPVSVLILQGTRDPLVPFDGGEVAWGNRGKIISTAQTVKAWVKHNGCTAPSRSGSLPDKDATDGCTVQSSSWSDCRDGTGVTLYTLEGAGHTWPGGAQYLPERWVGKVCRDIDATEIIWEFFRSHPKR
jgi:polyhydroxybutyrate depolymerase